MLTAVTMERLQEIKLEKQAVPVLPSEEVLIKVAYCEICGSDLHAYSHAKGYEFFSHPRVLGHEIVGEIVCQIQTFLF